MQHSCKPTKYTEFRSHTLEKAILHITKTHLAHHNKDTPSPYNEDITHKNKAIAAEQLLYGPR